MIFNIYDIPNIDFAQHLGDLFSASIHSENDVVSALDIGEIDRLSETVADFLIKSGSEMYPAQKSADYRADGAFMRSVRNEAARMKESLSLAYDEAYKFIMKYGDTDVLVGISGNRPLSYAEFKEHFPDLSVNETAGEYTLDKILVQSYEAPDTYSTSSDYSAGTDIVNEAYKVSYGLISRVALTYKNDAGSLLGIRVNDIYTKEFLGVLGYAEFEGYENYYAQIIEGEIYDLCYYDGGATVEFGFVSENENVMPPAISPGEAARIIDMLDIPENIDYYGALVGYSN